MTQYMLAATMSPHVSWYLMQLLKMTVQATSGMQDTFIETVHELYYALIYYVSQICIYQVISVTNSQTKPRSDTTSFRYFDLKSAAFEGNDIVI